jgi:hypothetical protein
MMRIMRSKIVAALGLAALLLGVASCSQRNDDLNRVVDPYWEKSYFSPDETWYYRATIVDGSPAGGMWGAIGEGHWLLLERCKWEVTEYMLICWRDYEASPGSESQQWEQGDELYKGAPVAMFPIYDHFDIVRTYNPATGEEGNVISENRFDRPWFDRAYMRVDWSRNLVPSINFHLRLNQIADSFVVQPNDPGDPKRFRFNDDYFEVTTRSQFLPDLRGVFGWYGEGYLWDTTAQFIDLRHSFAKRDPANDHFEIVNMPGSVVLEDADGNEVRDENGFAQRELIRDRFGIYSTFGRTAWDPNRGITDFGRQFNATVFNIWERSKNDDGTEIPMEERTPQPIVYYTNVTHPKQLMNASIDRVGGQWNDVFKNVVFHAQPDTYASIDDVPDMFIVRENDCNPSNVQSVLANTRDDLVAEITGAAADVDFDGSIETVIAAYEGANSAENEDPFTVRQSQETEALEHLERICSALEYYTDPLISRDPSVAQFEYQRRGDVRFSMLNLVMQDHHAGWLGYGPMLGDPITGQTIQATANIAMIALDRYATRTVQMIDEMNGLIDFQDLVLGFDIQEYMAQKLEQHQQLTTFEASDELRANMERRFADMREVAGDEDVLREGSPGEMDERLSRIEGTSLENFIVGADDFAFFSEADTNMNPDLTLDEAMMESASPLRGKRRTLRPDVHQRFIEQMGHFSMDSPEILDRFTFGLATQFKDIESQRERFERIREEIYVAVQLHEVGHNVGLYHNFEGSSDALNYGERFWDLQALDADVNTAINNSTDQATIVRLQRCLEEQDRLNDRYGTGLEFTTQECLRQPEAMYSTIMDYHGQWNGDFNGLGPYDEAAIAFAYGKLLQVFETDALAVDPRNTDIREWSYYNDWRDLAGDIVRDEAAINDRTYVKWDWDATSAPEATPANAVPFRFCPGGWYGQTPWCQVFDTGPDQQTNAAFQLTRYYQYYFWSHFNRGRLLDLPGAYGGAVGSDSRVMYDFTKKMQWYFFMKTDPRQRDLFEGSYAEEDFLNTTVLGLNHIGQVLGHPRSGFQVSVDQYIAETLINKPLDEMDLLAPSEIMISYNNLGQCTSRTLAPQDGIAPGTPQAGHVTTQIPLGDGRPFFFGLTEDYEDWYLRYMGTYWTKSEALFWLGYNRAWFPRTTELVDPRIFSINWYRLFPEEVGGIIHDLVVEDYVDFGPVVAPDGTFEPRQLIDPATGRAPDYSQHRKVLPTISYVHQFQGALYAMALMSSPWDDEVDMVKTFKVAVEGAEDDFGAFDQMVADAIANGDDPADVVAEFVHPISGQKIRGLKVGDNAIGYDMVERLNKMKERFVRLDACVDDPDGLALTDEYCSCINVIFERELPNGTVERRCTVDQNGNIANPTGERAFFEPPGTGDCTLADLENRHQNAQQTLDDMVDFTNTLRQFYTIFSEF